jgi:hypothetical protein
MAMEVDSEDFFQMACNLKMEINIKLERKYEKDFTGLDGFDVTTFIGCTILVSIKRWRTSAVITWAFACK